MAIIWNQPEPDPQADFLMVDAYMRWAMEAVKKAIGQPGLEYVLRQAGLERLIANPPSGELTADDQITFHDYASFSAALVNHFQRPGKNMVMRIGRESAQMGMSFQRGIFNLATVIAAKTLPTQVQLKMGLAAMLAGFRLMYKNKVNNQPFIGTIEDRGDYFAVILETCPFCAGKQSTSCIGWLWEATLEEAGRQVFGKFHDVVEVECRAKGDAAGVWLVAKQPSDESLNRSADMIDPTRPATQEAAHVPTAHVSDLPAPDAVADMLLIDAYMHWALLAIESVVGERHMATILRQAGLDRLINAYPPDEARVVSGFTFRDYARLNASLIELLGPGATGITCHIGELSARFARHQQFDLFNLAKLIESQHLPPRDLLRLGLESLNNGFRLINAMVNQEWQGHIEEQADGFRYVVKTCALCAGQRSNACMGGIFEGLLAESAGWLLDTPFETREIECRAKGDPAGVWEIRPKTG